MHWSAIPCASISARTSPARSRSRPVGFSSIIRPMRPLAAASRPSSVGIGSPAKAGEKDEPASSPLTVSQSASHTSRSTPVVRLKLASCSATSVPSPSCRTSISAICASSSTARFRAAAVFSGAKAPPARWAMIWVVGAAG